MKNRIHIFRMLVLMALAVCMAFFAVAPKPEAIAQTPDAQAEASHDEADPGNDRQQRLIAYEAIVPAFQVNISHDLLFTFEFIVFQEKEFEPSFEKPTYLNNLIKILFRQIISPNAP